MVSLTRGIVHLPIRVVVIKHALHMSATSSSASARAAADVSPVAQESWAYRITDRTAVRHLCQYATILSQAVSHRRCEALKQLNFHCPQSLLRAHRDTIEEQVGRIRRRRSTKRSRCSQPDWHQTQSDAGRLFLKHLGLQRRKVGLLQPKATLRCKRSIKKVGATLSRSASW